MLKATAWARGLMIGDPETMIGTTARLVEGTAAESAAAEMQAGIGTPQVLYMHLCTKSRLDVLEVNTWLATY